MNSSWEWVPAQSTTAEPTATISSPRLISDCAGSLIGLPGRISCSLPKAMLEPQNEIEPTIAPKSSKVSARSAHLPRPPWEKPWRYSTQAISATAPPPTPLNSATICGIAVIFTLRAAGIPTAAPMTIPAMISQTVLEPWNSPVRSSVATTATAIPTAAV